MIVVHFVGFDSLRVRLCLTGREAIHDDKKTRQDFRAIDSTSRPKLSRVEKGNMDFVVQKLNALYLLIFGFPPSTPTSLVSFNSFQVHTTSLQDIRLKYVKDF